VVRDFHFASLKNAIEPMVIAIRPWRGTFAIKIAVNEVQQSLAVIEKHWNNISPAYPFNFLFLDESFYSLYQQEQKESRIFTIFAFISIFIACLGLFGLAAFSAEQRTKELGIRKVLGASVSGLAGLLSKDFVQLVLIANLIAWPIGYFAMNKWLQNFAYRIDMSWWVFALAGGLALVIALLTVSTQAIKAALANPVESLRYE
jgi:putative ABC transport system permease protein